jgi:alkylation response protein AidB-like acyl-CoA dehydrogenase
VRFSFNEEQEELRRSARAFLDKHSSSERVRAAMASERGYEEAVWQKLATELGWTAVTIPETYGGLGLGMVELVALMEEAGRALLCSPFFATIALAANTILEAASDAQKAELLPAIAAGERTATVALTEPGGGWDADSVEATARREGSGFILDGIKRYVVDGDTADLLVVAAREPGTRGHDGIGLFALEPGSAGVERTWLPTMDQTRRLAEVRFTGVRVDASARLGGDVTAWPAIARTLDLAAIVLAAEQVGGAARCLDMTVAYAKERKQFGRPIGSFQAIKHKCADMLLRVESARSAAYYAGWAASVGDPELHALASLAKTYCSDAYFHAAAESVQIHGGVGFTWEYDVHLHFKRAKSSELLLGSPAHHRESVARHIGLGERGKPV